MPIPNAIRPGGTQPMNTPGVEGATVIDNVQDRIDYLDAAKVEASAVLTTEQVQDLVAGMIVAGSNVSAVYNDTTGTLTISSTGGSGGGSMTREEVEDLLAASFVAGAGVLVSYSDVGNTFTITNNDGGAAAVAAHAALPDPHPGYETTAEGTAKANAAQAAAEATAAAALAEHHSSASVDHDDRYYTENEVDAFLAAKSGTGHTHSAGNLDSLSDVAITSPTTGQVVKFNGTAWVNDTDSGGGGGAPTGDAGGDLAGTYPNPTIAPGVIVNADVNASAAIDQSKIAGLTSDLAGKAAASHAHSGADITSGTVPVARIPTGSTGSTVALGNHTHSVTVTGEVVFGIAGAATVRTGTAKVPNKSGRTRTITGVTITATTAPTGATMIADANINGTTIFGTQANRPTITAGSTALFTTTGMSVTSWADGQWLTVDIDQTGSAVAGSDVTVTIHYTEVA